jgi:uncharacterized protein YndB with AHSA1/START domain
MSKPKFVYVIYIAATADKIWEALTSATMSAQYWFGYSLISDFRKGSPLRLTQNGGEIMDKGVILESDPPRRLSYSWFPQYEKFKDERPSRVTFELTPLKDQVKLTIIHDDFDEGSKVFESISMGWPAVLSSLKSFLETGTPLASSWSDNEQKIGHDKQ